MKKSSVELIDISKRYGQAKVLDNLSLRIGVGEFFSLLGPSGSGKTTCLRIIAGFEFANSGILKIEGLDNSEIPPNRRPVNTVFQDYALFPNMTVRDNIAYGPKIRGLSSRERNKQADKYLEMMRIGELAKRRPSQLSGGQRQRVALARAIINHPRVLLLDEPLGALDQKLREEMQTELKKLQKELGITFIFVTHDQQEALSISDRICLLNGGKIEQLGTPTEVYDRPQTLFSAKFLGKANIIDAGFAPELANIEGLHAIRSEKIEYVPAGEHSAGDDKVSLTCEIDDMQFQGRDQLLICRTGNGKKLLVTLNPGLTESLPTDTNERRITVRWNRVDMVPLKTSPT